MRSLDVEDPESADPARKVKERPALAWWFRAGCFCYSAAGLSMQWRLWALQCDCPSYPWPLEATLLLLQGILSYLHDAHFEGRSLPAKIADRSCATFLTLCQPVKFAFCPMDHMQMTILAVAWCMGLAFFLMASRAFAAGDFRRYQIFHSFWHITLPLGGILWIEYTQKALPHVAASLGLDARLSCAGAALLRP
mmetsp:Transcript_54366/g.117675  ORF Transcript_54366/g.117675 Transcript_54366/m.117675 type:complete len:194 (+) Transcript_54366:35-616(+)